MNKIEYLNQQAKQQNAPDRKHISFKMTYSEIYMIKENNVKRIHDILRNSYTAKPNEECNVKFN